MILLQAIAVIFALFMLYVVRIHKRKKHLNSFEYGIWIGLWIVFLILCIFPQTIQGVAETLHIARVFDLLVIISFMVVMFLTFQNWTAYKALDNKLEEIIRRKAINETKTGSSTLHHHS